MKNIIDALTSSYSLEGEFEVQKSIQFIQNMEDIELLKPYAIKLLQTNAKQAHFISSSIEVISQQAAYIFKLEKQLKKKKATLWDRIKYVLLNKKSGN
jgi:SpoU rRNA methylase family enzyme